MPSVYRWERGLMGAEPQYPHISGPEWIARQFHEVYEMLAPAYGYETRRESAVPWDQVPAANRRLMVKTVTQLLHRGVIDHGPESPWEAARSSLSEAPADPSDVRGRGRSDP